jgi:hypothetical protein
MQQYQTAPDFGFTRSTIGGLPTTLNHVNPAYYHQIGDFVTQNDARMASANGLVLYDTLRLDPATSLSTSGFKFFQNGINTQQGLYNAGTAYTKQEIDVHPWIQNGKLDEGYEALIWSIQIRLQLPGASDLTVQTTGNALNLTLSPGAIVDEPATAIQGAAIKTGNIMRALQEALFFRFFVNDTRFEVGPLWRFPCVYQTANQIGLAGVVANPLNDAVIGNGMGFAYSMPFMRHIPSNTRFGVEMLVQNGFSFAITNGVPQMRLVVILEGIGISPITG